MDVASVDKDRLDTLVDDMHLLASLVVEALDDLI